MIDQARRALGNYHRVAIVGGPKAGKTTLTKTITDRPVIHTDDLIGQHDWSALSQAVVDQCAELPRFVVEGVRAAHALRKGLEVDAVIVLEGAHAELSPRQAGMTKAVNTVLKEWRAHHPRVPVIRIEKQ